MDSITRFQIKETGEQYLVKDSNAVKAIRCIYKEEKEENFTPDADGVVSITIPTMVEASSEVAGGVKIGTNEDVTNIHIDDDGYIAAIVPIKGIKGPENSAFSEVEDEDKVFQIPMATEDKYGLVKTSNIIKADESGKLYLAFGENYDFNNIKTENEEIIFNLADFEEEV